MEGCDSEYRILYSFTLSFESGRTGSCGHGTAGVGVSGADLYIYRDIRLFSEKHYSAGN